jgi:hypothetical protein
MKMKSKIFLVASTALYLFTLPVVAMDADSPVLKTVARTAKPAVRLGQAPDFLAFSLPRYRLFLKPLQKWRGRQKSRSGNPGDEKGLKVEVAQLFANVFNVPATHPQSLNDTDTFERLKVIYEAQYDSYTRVFAGLCCDLLTNVGRVKKNSLNATRLMVDPNVDSSLMHVAIFFHARSILDKYSENKKSLELFRYLFRTAAVDSNLRIEAYLHYVYFARMAYEGQYRWNNPEDVRRRDMVLDSYSKFRALILHPSITPDLRHRLRLYLARSAFEGLDIGLPYSEAISSAQAHLEAVMTDTTADPALRRKATRYRSLVGQWSWSTPPLLDKLLEDFPYDFNFLVNSYHLDLFDQVILRDKPWRVLWDATKLKEKLSTWASQSFPVAWTSLGFPVKDGTRVFGLLGKLYHYATELEVEPFFRSRFFPIAFAIFRTDSTSSSADSIGSSSSAGVSSASSSAPPQLSAEQQAGPSSPQRTSDPRYRVLFRAWEKWNAIQPPKDRTRYLSHRRAGQVFLDVFNYSKIPCNDPKDNETFEQLQRIYYSLDPDTCALAGLSCDLLANVRRVAQYSLNAQQLMVRHDIDPFLKSLARVCYMLWVDAPISSVTSAAHHLSSSDNAPKASPSAAPPVSSTADAALKGPQIFNVPGAELDAPPPGLLLHTVSAAQAAQPSAASLQTVAVTAPAPKAEYALAPGREQNLLTKENVSTGTFSASSSASASSNMFNSSNAKPASSVTASRAADLIWFLLFRFYGRPPCFQGRA